MHVWIFLICTAVRQIISDDKATDDIHAMGLVTEFIYMYCMQGTGSDVSGS